MSTEHMTLDDMHAVVEEEERNQRAEERDLVEALKVLRSKLEELLHA